MLSYLASALPQFTSPATRLLALQCALRADTTGRVRLTAGMLRGMRLHGRMELWEELEYAAWLCRAAGRHPHLEAQLLDRVLLSQPDSRARARAAHWALRPVPLEWPAGRPPAVSLVALVLAAQDSGGACSADLDGLAHLCGLSSVQTAELLDRLVASQVLAGWRHDRESDEVFWWMPVPGEGNR